MQLADFDYDLPEQAIAQVPTEPRDEARLLVDRGEGRAPEHHVVRDLPSLVRPGDVLVVNTTRVLPARLRLRKPSGGEVEVLLLERFGDGTWEALVRPSRRIPAGTRLTVGDDLVVAIGATGREEGTRQVRLQVPNRFDQHGGSGQPAGTVPPLGGSMVGGEVTSGGAGAPDRELGVLARHGVVPLPPYITASLADPERYQTVFADRPESVAAPTAGLHLTPGVLDGCSAVGATVVPVELAVGLGTFRPMTASRVEDHRMHAERYHVPGPTLKACWEARAHGGRVVAVGTTVVRALESAAATGEPEGRTELFIRGPYDWQLVDVLMTNFHLPRSSLLVLVDAFVGPRWREIYELALTDGYRFLSFGDAMLLERTSRVGVRAGGFR